MTSAPTGRRIARLRRDGTLLIRMATLLAGISVAGCSPLGAGVALLSEGSLSAKLPAFMRGELDQTNSSDGIRLGVFVQPRPTERGIGLAAAVLAVDGSGARVPLDGTVRFFAYLREDPNAQPDCVWEFQPKGEAEKQAAKRRGKPSGRPWAAQVASDGATPFFLEFPPAGRSETHSAATGDPTVTLVTVWTPADRFGKLRPVADAQCFSLTPPTATYAKSQQPVRPADASIQRLPSSPATEPIRVGLDRPTASEDVEKH